MIPKKPKIGDVFADSNAHYEVIALNEDGTFNSRLLIGYVPDTVIDEETVKEMKKAVEKKAPAKKPSTAKKK